MAGAHSRKIAVGLHGATTVQASKNKSGRHTDDADDGRFDGADKCDVADGDRGSKRNGKGCSENFGGKGDSVGAWEVRLADTKLPLAQRALPRSGPAVSSAGGRPRAPRTRFLFAMLCH